MPKVKKERQEPTTLAVSVAKALRTHVPRPFERRVLIKRGKRLASTIVRMPRGK